MGDQDLHRPLVGVVDDGPDLFVDLLRDLVGVVPLLADLPAQEDQLVALAEGQRPETIAHPELRDHPASQVGRLLDVVRRARGGVAEDESLRGIAAEQTRDLVLELGLGLEIPILGRQGHRVAEGHAAADDRDLADRVALREDPLHDRMAALVEGDDRLLGIRDDPGLPLRPGDDPLERLGELGHPDRLLVPARRQDRRLVDEVREIGAGEAGRLAGDAFDVDELVERLALGMDLEDRDATLHVRPVEDDLAVEAARPQECRVEDVRPVGGRDDDHVRVRVEAVHLDEDLVEGLLALVVGAAEAGAALATDCVDLVDEDDARRIALGLIEQVADARGADADEHLDELRAGDREERDAGLAGDGPGHQRLAGAGRPDEQHAARDPRAERVELLRIFQELDDFLKLGLRLVDAGHVGKRHDGLVAEEHPGAGLAEREGLVIGALRLSHHEEDEPADDQDRQEAGDQDADPAVVRSGLGPERRGRDLALGSRGSDIGQDLIREQARNDDRVGRRAVRGRHGQRRRLLRDRLDGAVLDVVEEDGVVDGFGRRGVVHDREHNGKGDDHQGQHHHAVAEEPGIQQSLRGVCGRRRATTSGSSIASPRDGPMRRRSCGATTVITGFASGGRADVGPAHEDARQPHRCRASRSRSRW